VPRSATELMKTLERVGVPSGIADRNGTLTWLNKRARAELGDIVGQPFKTAVAPEYRRFVERQLDQKLRGAPVTDYEVELLSPDGSRRRAEISSVRIEGGDACHAVFGIALMGASQPGRPVAELTRRQAEVLRLLGQGASTEQIAASLHLSKETVRNHVQRVFRALGAHSRLEAVLIAHREGLLSSEN
jgi:PAS domain S-box-containing protein